MFGYIQLPKRVLTRASIFSELIACQFPLKMLDTLFGFFRFPGAVSVEYEF